MGCLFVGVGAFPILIGLGVLTPTTVDPDQAPPWVAVCAGVMFVMAGLAIVLDYGIAGGVGADGDLLPGTPMAIRIGNLLLGGTIVGLMTAVFGWVAFGPGPRNFSSTVSLPFLSFTRTSGELFGRVIFGIATALMALMFLTCTIVGIERLWRARKQ
jgi:hypothetical protein